jgi:endoglucanase
MDLRILLFVCSIVCCAADARAQDGNPAAGVPRVVHVGMAAPNVITLMVKSGHIETGRHVPYVPQPGDEVRPGVHRTLSRDGDRIGALVGSEQEILHTADRFVGGGFDTVAADSVDSYVVVSADDPRYRGGLEPVRVGRKSKPDGATNPPAPRRYSMEHVLYLRMPASLTAGSTYSVRFPGGLLATDAGPFTFDPLTLRSESVHTTQIGFRPADPVKVAYLSTWMGTAGGLTYDGPVAFGVLREGDTSPVFRGTAALRSEAKEAQNGAPADHVGADVWEMDFSELTQPGTYRVSVDGVGCSFPFEIGNAVWQRPFYTGVRGLYHQRSGIPLGPPHTDFVRPRSFHPDDGVRVYQSTYTHDIPPEGGIFRALVAGKTDEILPNAWGGYMDAGDWDRRPAHIKVSRHLFELYQMAPDYFSGLRLDIPESGDGLPDIINEALWCVDFHRRLQKPDGGVPSGIESAEHPRQGEASWDESLDIMAFAPCPSMSYRYAGVAARAARVLDSLGHPQMADGYRRSAIAAFDWAVANAHRFTVTRRGDVGEGRFDADRALASLELYRLTGRDEYHADFMQCTRLKAPDLRLPVPGQSQDTPSEDSAWLYLQLPPEATDAELRAHIRSALLRQADRLARSTQETAFGWAANPGERLMWGALTCVKRRSLARAHYLTGAEEYYSALLRAAMVGAGANPLNVCYTTGVGERSPRNVLHVDARISGQAPPPGITVGGPAETSIGLSGTGWVGKWQKPIATQVAPAIENWPTTEAFWDIYRSAPVCEFTVHNILIYNIYTWGYLASRP